MATPKSGLKINTRRPRRRPVDSTPSGSIRSPRPRITTGPSCRKSGQSEPSPAASSSLRPDSKATPLNASNARNAATALPLPPPNPAPTGMRFSNANATRPRHPVAAAKASAARNTRLPPSVGTPGASQTSVAAPVSPAHVARSVSPQASGATTETSS